MQILRGRLWEHLRSSRVSDWQGRRINVYLTCDNPSLEYFMLNIVSSRRFNAALKIAAFSIGLGAMVSAGLAQQPVPVRVRGVIDSTDGSTLQVKLRDGAIRVVHLSDKTRIAALAKASLADVKVDSFVGITSVPDGHGGQRAVEIHIFPEAMRGAGEGQRPWDLLPNSTMTNATVATAVAGVDGQTIKVKYKGGEAEVATTPETQIVTLGKGDRDELKAGMPVVIMGAKRDDGDIDAGAVNIGRDGLKPPM